MTPKLNALHKLAVRIAKRADELAGILKSERSSIPDDSARFQALIMALLERDYEVTSEIDEQVRIAEWVDSVPAEESLARANVHELIDAAGLPSLGRVSVGRSREHDFTYGVASPTLLFGYEVELGRRKTIVCMPGLPPANWQHVRCYIDGDSWMWKYAPEHLSLALKPERKR